MKRIFIISLIAMFFAAPALALDVLQNANQATVQWDASDGATSYRVFAKPISGGDSVQVWTGNALECVLTFVEDAAVIVGIQAVKTATVSGLDDPVEEVSEIAWSDNPLVCRGGKTFGVYYVSPPAMVLGVGLKQ